MTITYPLSLPASLTPRGVAITASAVVAVAESPFTFGQQVQEHQGQRWLASFEYPPLTRAQADALHSFLLKLNGRKGTFLLGDPVATAPRGIGTGTPLVKGASQTGNSLITDGWTISTTGILLAGDYIQLGSGSTARLYRVLDDANSNGAGEATLTIWPNLRSSPADNAVITVNSAMTVFRMASNDMTYSIAEALVYGVGFDAVEAL